MSPVQRCETCVGTHDRSRPSELALELAGVVAAEHQIESRAQHDMNARRRAAAVTSFLCHSGSGRRSDICSTENVGSGHRFPPDFGTSPPNTYYVPHRRRPAHPPARMSGTISVTVSQVVRRGQSPRRRAVGSGGRVRRTAGTGELSRRGLTTGGGEGNGRGRCRSHGAAGGRLPASQESPSPRVLLLPSR